MKLSNPKQVINLDDYLPQDGESRFEMHYLGGALSVEIFYDKDDISREAKRSIRFSQAKYFFKTPFPGYSFFNCEEDRNIALLNSLVEYENSDMLAVEANASGDRGLKHYRLFLHSAGVAIHAIAKSCEISNEVLCE
jgi:hypothetical protein